MNRGVRYRIIARIGTGGMGAVYHATDTVLHRSVALKILTAGALDEAHARARLLREARAAASLSHPNVCTVYEAGELAPDTVTGLALGDGPVGTRPTAAVPFLSMEFIEGRTLAEIIRERGPLALPDLLDVAIQIAEGLAAAHQRGIVHRDLKPGNIMVTTEGRAKVLDFGLARPLDPPGIESSRADLLETVTRELDRHGSVMGTLAYISPERALGKPGDSRSDVFSFGIMLYEMAAGDRPFVGETTTAVLAKILEAEPPPLARIRPDAPDALTRIIARCLRKAPEKRFNDTRDLVVALRELRVDPERKRATTSLGTPRGADDDATREVAAPPLDFTIARRRVRRIAKTAIAALLLVLAGVVTAVVVLRPRAPAPPASRLSRITSSGDVLYPALSPDGNFIAFVRRRSDVEDGVVVHDIRSGSSLEVYRGGSILSPSWSPDGSLLAFAAFSRRTGEGEVVTVPLLGESPRVIAREPANLLAWSPDGRRILAYRGGAELLLIDRETGGRTPLPTPHPHAWIEGIDWSPEGSILLLTRDERGTNEIWVLSADGRREERLESIPEPFPGTARWSGGGDRIYYVARDQQGRGSAPVSVLTRIDLDRITGKRKGAPVSLGQVIFVSLSLSRDGTRLAYPEFSRSYSVTRVDLATGVSEDLGTEGARTWTGRPRVSPDGRRLLYRADRGTGDLSSSVFVVSDRDGASPRVVASAPGMSQAVWSPTGDRIAGFTEEAGDRRLIIVSLVSGKVQSLAGIRPGESVEWSPGPQLLYQRADRRNFVLRDPDSGAERPLLAEESAGVWQARYAPDGARVAFARTVDPAAGMSVAIAAIADGIAREVYAGRAAPIGWSADGAVVFLVRESPSGLAAGGRLTEIVACPVSGGDVSVLLTLPGLEFWSQMDVAPDGKELVYTRSTPQGDAWLLENFDPGAR